jgi:hypothetical protein
MLYDVSIIQKMLVNICLIPVILISKSYILLSLLLGHYISYIKAINIHIVPVGIQKFRKAVAYT